ncbi:unnamed protein product [Eruca vesicaria subsp. sativa]|uniref:CHHC U11-48K-type domain-containing protein n=1 Tax=Eruca vesicaria subsp. sativa TaxID=29727 RepID=A0ABC8LUF9_ERUVS|nr:unnamed protein product [Eruca vesicaria subsp. sativa]
MDRPPSFPNYLNPNPNFFHPPPPPPIRDLSATLSSLQSLLSESQRTLASLSQNLSSLLHKDGFVQCPFDPNHQMPPEALFLHSLHCHNPLDLTPFLESFSSYRNTLELPIKPELNNVDDLCFSLDDVTDFGNNFFYNDCPAVVNFSEFNSKTRRFTLPSVLLLSVECSDGEQQICVTNDNMDFGSGKMIEIGHYQGTETIRGIDFDLSEDRGELIIDERAFEGMSRLQFLRFQKRGLYYNTTILLPQGLKFRARKLRFLEWDQFPLTCFPREFQPRRLVKLMMEHSKLEKLWEGTIA